jgi:hypothetical protein
MFRPAGCSNLVAEGADQQRGGSYRELADQKEDRMSSRPVRRTVTVLIALLSLTLLTAGAAQAAPPGVDHHQEFEIRTATDLNICGDLAVFDFNVKGSITVVEHVPEEVFHFHATWVGTYTVTFLDTSLGVWESTVREVISTQSTPGGTVVFRSILNSHEGPVRIHETIAFVLSRDGTVKVDRYTFDVVGCP